MSTYHRLLKRQLKKIDLSEKDRKPIADFLEMVDTAYHSFDRDVDHLETILEKSSQELYEANRRLRDDVMMVSQQLTNVAANIKDVIFEMDTSGNWTYLNPAWEVLMGCSVSQSLGTPYHLCFKNSEGVPMGDFLDVNTMGLGESSRRIEITSGQGVRKWIALSLKPLLSEVGSILGYIGTLSDITQLKKTELAMMRAHRTATKANKAKDDFLSMMSHEIRTPLNAVIGISNLLLLENPKADQMENLDALRYSSEHLLSLVNDILDFNKIASGSMKLDAHVFDLRGLLEKLERIFQPNAKEKQIALRVTTDPELPDLIVGDSSGISQVLTNLLSNALKFTEAGGVSLRVKVLHTTASKCELSFAIEDTGIGIPKKRLETIFNPFEQADSSIGREYGGSGLGLAICQQLLQLMDSSLEVVSKEGRGTTFSFVLNLGKTSETTPVNVIPEVSALTEEEDFPLKGVRILVAEDNRVNTMVIEKFLKKWQADYDLAENGKIATEKAASQRYDLILMDLHMPVMDGFEAAKTIRESKLSKNKSVPIYALSASTGVYTDRNIKDFGMGGLIPKPFHPGKLLQQLVLIVKESLADHYLKL